MAKGKEIRRSFTAEFKNAYGDFAVPRPSRRVVLAWRSDFTRQAAVRLLGQTIRKLDLPITVPGPSRTGANA